jgi:hypothetical protein
LTDGKIDEKEKKMKTLITICAAIILLDAIYARAGNWTTPDYPGAKTAEAYDISGSNVVGWYIDISGLHGFIYDGAWPPTTLDMPGADVTIINGISGRNVVGVYKTGAGEHGFLYDGTTWTTLDYPGALTTEARGIIGRNVVGVYEDSSGKHGFLYNGTTWTALDYPGATNTLADGISDSNIVGGYNDGSDNGHGFLYDGTTWTTLDYPGAGATEARGISRNSIVGLYVNSSGKHGFLYDGTTWTTLDYPGASHTYANGISGSNIVGSYEDESFRLHSFLFCSETKTSDLNGDCKVDFEDFAIFASEWLKGNNNANNVPTIKIMLDSDPAWITEGEWQFGTPMGMGGSSHGYADPTQGFTGQNVYGVNLNGDYTVALGGPNSLTAGPFDCSEYLNVELRFARWLNTDISYFVKCKVEVSNNGSNWQEIWSNPVDIEIADNQWQQQSFDISGIAKRQPTVYLRWSYQILNDRAYPYSGWNIDDVELQGVLD